MSDTTDATQSSLVPNYMEQGGSVLVIGGDLLVTSSGKITAAGTQAGPTTALTDSTGGGGSSGGTLAADVATTLLILPIPSLAALANAATLKILPGFAGKVTAVNFRVGAAPVTTGAKAATLTARVSGAAVTGGVVGLTSANCTPAGAAVAGSAITAANSFLATDTLEVAVSAVTTFAEGSGWVEFTVVNTDLAAALSTLAVQSNALLTILKGIGASS
ncbi:MAG: hypothetical protein KGO96_12875 [Elusimicrobia bacterium]|nr:hypothetical protein [Elusimicrobiota bacterium]